VAKYKSGKTTKSKTTMKPLKEAAFRIKKPKPKKGQA
jgi:hypothetical protein